MRLKEKLPIFIVETLIAKSSFNIQPLVKNDAYCNCIGSKQSILIDLYIFIVINNLIAGSTFIMVGFL